ncbi:MAG: hypothetical protein KI792_09465 [Alphaproteobacteria bacterium]|nr:hypothetical protein [Alphaproteobacteria bacterium SS10]
MLDRFGFGRGLSDDDLRLPPSNDFEPVARHLTETVSALKAIADNPPGKAPSGLMGPFYRMIRRGGLKRINAAIEAAGELQDDLATVVAGGEEADPCLREDVRRRLEDARPTLRKGLDSLISYHAVLLDDSGMADSLRTLSRRLMVSINSVTEERFNFGAVLDWVEDGKKPDVKLLPPPSADDCRKAKGEPPRKMATP